MTDMVELRRGLATALFIHVVGHRANARHRAIMHTHVLRHHGEGGQPEMAHQTAPRFRGRMAHYAFGGIALYEPEVTRIANLQRDDPHADILFLDIHGTPRGGESIAVAFDDLYYLERACRQQVLAQSTGLPLKLISEEMVCEPHRQLEQIRLPLAAAHFIALLRKYWVDE